MSKIPELSGNLRFLAQGFADLAEEQSQGKSKKLTHKTQNHPAGSTTYGEDYIGCYSTLGEEGRFSLMEPATYCESAFDVGTSHCFSICAFERYAYQQLMSETDSTHFQGPPNMVDGSGDYVIEIRKDDVVKTATTDYTIDKSTGIVTSLTSWTGSEVRWTGYYAKPAVKYILTDEMWYERGDVNGLQVLDLPNAFFDFWTDSTTPEDWTKTGNISRITSELQGTYAARITAASGSWHQLEQTITLGTAVDQVVALAVCKVSSLTGKIVLSVSVDGGSSWDSEVFTSGADSVDKWIVLAVESAVNSTTDVRVKIGPQSVNTETGTVDVEAICIIEGGLM